MLRTLPNALTLLALGLAAWVALAAGLWAAWALVRGVLDLTMCIGGWG